MASEPLPGDRWLDRLLGPDGRRVLERTRWRWLTAPTFVLGLVSDVMQIFGKLALYFFWLALAASLVLALVILTRSASRARCVQPCATALIALAVFGAVLGLQKLNASEGAEEIGTAAVLVPGVAELQEALRPILERLHIIEGGIEEIKEDTGRLLEGQEELLAQNRRLIELLEQEKGIPHAALINHLIRLGADERIEQAAVPAFLERFADEFVKLREQLMRQGNADPSIGAAREEALAFLETGDLEGARRLFRTTRERIREQRQALARDEAILLADEARVDRLELRYRDAATLLAEAADLVAFDAEASWEHRHAQANALYALGDEFGDNAALIDAIGVYETALTLAPRDERRDDWAVTQNNLANALAALGERESGTERLEQAVQAYEQALLEWTRERMPLDWADIQNNLGTALWRLGERENSTELLKQAVQAFESALLERTSERVPLSWAQTQNNLGGVLAALGERESSTELLEKAVRAYEQALLEQTRERVPLDWAKTQSNLGGALAALGRRESSTERLEQAVRAYEQALLERTRERAPLGWATTQYNLALTLAALAVREDDPAALRAAITAMAGAAEVFREGGNTYLLPWAEAGLEEMRRMLTEMEGGG